MEDIPASGRSFTDDYLPYLLSRAAHATFAKFESELRGNGITVPVWWILAALFELTTATVTELAGRCALQQPTVSKLLDRMGQQGLVGRTGDERDRRVVRVALTTEGSAMVAKLVEAAKQHEAALLPRYPQIQELKEVLRVIIADSAEAPGKAR